MRVKKFENRRIFREDIDKRLQLTFLGHAVDALFRILANDRISTIVVALVQY